jgi:S1-C subfamily serine protease
MHYPLDKHRSSRLGPRALITLLWSVVAFAAMFGETAAAEKRYIWTDGEGVTHFTKEAPPNSTSYRMVTVPDGISWQHAPPMSEEIPADRKLSSQELFKQVSRSVLWVESEAHDWAGTESVSYGSAVAISEDEVLTNCHVIGTGQETIRVGDDKQTVTENVELAAADFDADRCVLHVKGLTLQPIRGVRSISSLEIGETVYAIGNPRGLRRTISQGLISGVRDLGDVRFVQTTAAISPGSSGGGLFDTRGNLVAITALTLAHSQELNFAVPAEDFWK